MQVFLRNLEKFWKLLGFLRNFKNLKRDLTIMSVSLWDNSSYMAYDLAINERDGSAGNEKGNVG